MSQEIQNLPADTTDKIIAFINDQIHNVAASLQQYGPAAVNSIGRVKQYQAIGHLTMDFVILLPCMFFMAVAFIGIIIGYRNYSKIRDFECFNTGGIFLISLVVGILSLMVFSMNISCMERSFPSLFVSAMSPDTAFVNYIITDVIPRINK